MCLSLMRDLPHVDEECIEIEFLEQEVKTCANILRILSQELYHVHSSKIDQNLSKVLKEIVSEKRLLYWSKVSNFQHNCNFDVLHVTLNTEMSDALGWW